MEGNLERANPKKANLEAAVLVEAYWLSLDKLSKVKILCNTKLDEEVLIPPKEECPVLFR